MANALVSSRLDYCNSLGASPSSIYTNYSASRNSAARIVSNTSQYTSITSVLKRLHWLPDEQQNSMVFKTATLFTSFFTQVFLGILLYIFLPTAALTVPGSAKVVAMSLSFQSSTLLFINLSSSLVIVLLLIPLFGMLFQMRFVPPPLAPFGKQLKTSCTPKHTHLILDHPLVFSLVLDPSSASGY